MVSSEQPAAGSCPTAQIVGNAFVHQYYHILYQSPELVYRFYQDSSKLGRPEANGTMSSVTTMQAINDKILSLDCSGFRAEIKTVDAQDSLDDGVLVLVSGYLTGKDNVKRDFTQSFFLAPQDKGYFVLNDMFRYVEEFEHQDGNHGLAPLTPDQDPASAQEHRVLGQINDSSEEEEEEVNAEVVYNPSDNKEGSFVEEEAPVAEVVVEIQNGTHMVPRSTSPVQEELPKKSYASILKVMRESAGALPAPTLAPAKPAPVDQERQVVSNPPSAVAAAETPASSSNATTESGNNQVGEGDGHSIYIGNLPLNATPEQIEDEFRRFGPIKNGGVQVRSNKQQGFCFGFVQFEDAGAVQSAIEASPITIGSRQSHVEEKRTSSSRVNNNNNRGRFQPVSRGGFRNDGPRGRGNFGREGYVRRDFNTRSDFSTYRSRHGGGGGGGSSNREGGGYQRTDHMSNGGGRMNHHANALAVKETANTGVSETSEWAAF